MSEDRPPCPRCSFPYTPGAAERYWEARWRDEKAENERLQSALRAVQLHDTCMRCMGSGFSNHPDSNEICDDCQGSGAVSDMTKDRKSKS